jgi:dTDP-4-dehydrorhamnose reductase
LITHAIIAAGVTSVKACEQSIDSTRAINVSGTIELCKALLDSNIFIIYLSTSLVFGNSQVAPTVLIRPTPDCEYGKQKQEVEDFLISSVLSTCILRITKVLGYQNKLFATWANALLECRPIHAFSDYGLAPVPIHLVFSAIQYIISSNACGIVHLSAKYPISYFNAASYLCQYFSKDLRLVYPTTSSLQNVINAGSSYLDCSDSRSLLHHQFDPYFVLYSHFTSSFEYPSP